MGGDGFDRKAALSAEPRIVVICAPAHSRDDLRGKVSAIRHGSVEKYRAPCSSDSCLRKPPRPSPPRGILMITAWTIATALLQAQRATPRVDRRQALMSPP